jgi:hypothetical protein
MTAVVGNVAADHPAKWSTPVLEAMADVVEAEHARVSDRLRVLDPFAGIGRGRLHLALQPWVAHVVGVELQPEWCTEGTELGNACHLPGCNCHPGPDDWTGRYHAVVTSPCYGNRCADHHQAADLCKKCKGSGCTVANCLGGHPDDCQDHRLCPTCKGTGLSWRNTYAHALRRHGADLVAGSAAALQWGPEYRALHRRALGEMIRVVVEGGLLAINMSNHLRTATPGGPQVEQLVVEWWVNELVVAGCRLWEVRRVGTQRNGKGANGQARVDGEVILVVHTPSPRRLL